MNKPWGRPLQLGGNVRKMSVLNIDFILDVLHSKELALILQGFHFATEFGKKDAA